MRVVWKLCLIWILYALISLVVPPFFHKTAENGSDAAKMVWQQATDTGEMGRQTGTERVLNLESNQDALLWRLRLIEAARERIVLTTFDFRDDNGGRDMMAALLAAADRGVQVQILVDGIYGTMKLSGSSAFAALSGHENVTARFYNPVDLLRPWKANYRMHDKYLIADDFAYILGGRNTDDLFLGEYVERYNDDRDILVYETVPGGGSSYRSLQAYFEQIWELPCNTACKVWTSGGDGMQILRARYEWMREEYPEAFADTDWVAATMAAERIELYTNPIEAVNKEPVLWAALADEMGQGKEVLIQTPYIICSDEMYDDLAGLTKRGIRIELVINAVESGTNPFGCTDYLNQKKKISQTGADIYEYLGAQAAHTKTILVDDRISIVGSCNLDMRSVYLDTEMMLVIDCPELNERIRSRIEAMKRVSRHVSPEWTTEDGPDYLPAEESAGRKLFYAVLRVLIVPLRHLL